ncbi:50S ribosomal protein L11 methyltransferase [Sediminibacterium soli]|uniref:50S ribosomal protein L11 methyltransferase n=1 Tax=Sediminibacterium soli TaxID=2698829 RepID=UPI001379B71D|nr:50S ribosomal protein L11 methyltransferase [Sediminibacterium soli]NCI46065.1 50S ribosomal protein L11 methyltransferase [Sediminibacterium soli]
MNYIEIILTCPDEAQRALLVAGLSELGYEGFEETDDQLKAYVPENRFAENGLQQFLKEYDLPYSKSVIRQQNWNALWEAGFEPVQVDDFVGIRAAFHPPIKGVMHELVITPKMSFGTGHHATTWLVMQLMRGIDFSGETVFDFGTGTGILAILAEKLGASELLAVDYDDWCIENATENLLLNGCRNITIEKLDNADAGRIFGIVLANINRHIVLDNLGAIRRSLAPGGDLLLSGLLTADENDILSACRAQDFHHVETRERNGWIAIRLKG